MNTLVTIIASCLGVLSFLVAWIALSFKQSGGRVKMPDGETIDIGCLGCFSVWGVTFSIVCFLVAFHPQWIIG